MKSYQEFNESKQTDWTLVGKPKTLEVLSKIDAPNEWKKMVLSAMKLEYTAWGQVNQWGMKPEKAYDLYGNKWYELMTLIGNPMCQEGSESPNYPYWLEYTKLRGNVVDYNFSDCLA
jgi:hypothetical protein